MGVLRNQDHRQLAQDTEGLSIAQGGVTMYVTTFFSFKGGVGRTMALTTSGREKDRTTKPCGFGSGTTLSESIENTLTLKETLNFP